MDITRTAGLVAGLLVATGVVAFAITGANSVTALIPAFLGLVMGGLVMLAKAKPSATKAAMHGVVIVALLGALGSIGRVVPAMVSGEIALPIAFAAQLVTTILCIALVAAAIRHFRAQRRA